MNTFGERSHHILTLRGSYVDGDPRYHKQKFKTNDQREQVVLWAEKEWRYVSLFPVLRR